MEAERERAFERSDIFKVKSKSKKSRKNHRKNATEKRKTVNKYTQNIGAALLHAQKCVRGVACTRTPPALPHWRTPSPQGLGSHRLLINRMTIASLLQSATVSQSLLKIVSLKELLSLKTAITQD